MAGEQVAKIDGVSSGDVIMPASSPSVLFFLRHQARKPSHQRRGRAQAMRLW